MSDDGQKLSEAQRYHDLEEGFGARANEAAITSSNHFFRALVLINGGAAIALLAFAGQLVSVEDGQYLKKLGDLIEPLIRFACGVGLATVGIGAAYVTNFCIASTSALKSRINEHPYVVDTVASKWWRWSSYFFHVCAFMASLAAIGFFICGMWEISKTISGLSVPVAPG